MLRRSGRPRQTPSSRPRTRGDAPDSGLELSAPFSSAPHARGCSRLVRRGLLVPRVGPARAGMLRWSAVRGRGCCRRPRTRGDAPAVVVASPRSDPSAPRSRGCSEAGVPAAGPGVVGPACAGMLRDHHGQAVRLYRRPRTRGDAPTASGQWQHRYVSAPHARGCSELMDALQGLLAVGPAPAGMLPSRRRATRRPRRRPRTRGDAPGPGCFWGYRVSAPHPRGCSPAAGGEEGQPQVPELDLPGVGPAPAGKRCNRALGGYAVRRAAGHLSPRCPPRR
uniref:Uncharacterized protein n=1 Tax=Streptomyces sp. HK1 TaxID=405041 RepID=B0LU60_9ACTN|nr:hypothetical protein pSHK1.72 [Streptomyces sp. HK1]